jgi:autotransporter translocation and assembly factor TamB
MRLVRGSKIKLTDVDPRLVEEAMRPAHRLVARIRLTGSAGEPGLTWSAEPAHAQPGSG